MKRFLLHIIYITALLPLLGSCSCQEDAPEGISGDGNVQLSLSVTARALPQEGKETGTGTPDKLHLWVFGSKNDNQNANGYDRLAYREVTENLFTGSDPFGNPVHTITDLEIPEGKKYDKLHFHVVLNSASVTGMDAISGEMTVGELQELTFSGTVPGKDDNGQLMYGSFVEKMTSSNHYDIDIPVERCVAKLEMFFTRRYDESELTVNSIDLYPVVGRGHLVPVGKMADGDYVTQPAAVTLLGQPTGIASTSSEEFGDFSGDEANFTKLTSSYLLENLKGLAEWDYGNDPDGKYPETGPEGSAHYYKVHVAYTLDGKQETREFYLPAILRNHLYRIYARIAPGDKPIRFQIEVIEWEDGGNGDINEWEY